MKLRNVVAAVLMVFIVSAVLSQPKMVVSATTGSILVGDENAGFFNVSAAHSVLTIAPMSEPEGVATYAGGSYIVVQGASAPGVYRVFPNGTVVSIATGSPFKFSQGVAVAGDGSIIVADSWARSVFRVFLNGTVRTIFHGSPLGSPMDVAIQPNGYLLVADEGNGLFNVTSGSATEVLSASVYSIAHDNGSGYLYTTGTGLYSFDPVTHATSSIASGFAGAFGVTVDSLGNYIVADRNAPSGGTIYAVTHNGTKLVIAQGSPLDAPMRVAVVGFVDAIALAQVVSTTTSTESSSAASSVASESTSSSTTSTTYSTPITTATTPVTTYSSSSIVATHASSDTSSNPISSSESSTPIPEFPLLSTAAVLASLVLVGSYMFVRSRSRRV